MTALLSDPEVMRHYPAPKSRDEAANWIAWNERNYAEHGFGLWIIELADGTFVGDCGLTIQDVEGEGMVEVGYHVATAWQGRGLAAEAAGAVRDAGGSSYGAHTSWVSQVLEDRVTTSWMIARWLPLMNSVGARRMCSLHANCHRQQRVARSAPRLRPTTATYLSGSASTPRPH